MIPRNRGGVHRRTSSRSHETGDVSPTPVPTIDDLLRIHPLPPALAHLEETVRAFPGIDALIATVFGCMAAGLDERQIHAALDKVLWHAAQPTQQCSCCRVQRSGADTFAHIEGGSFSLITVCPVCARLIQSGRATTTMRRNLQAYLHGGAS